MGHQGNLPFLPHRDEISDAAIIRCQDMKAAIRLCFEVSGLPIKDLAFQLDVDERQLSRMMASNPDDKRYFPPELLGRLMDICGNEIPLRWLALNRGFGLHRLKSKVELENDELRRRLEERDREMAVIKNFLREVRLAS